MRSLRVVEVLSDSPLFARHHRVRLPKAGDTLSLEDRKDGGAFGVVERAEWHNSRPGDPAVAVKVVKQGLSLDRPVAALHEALARCRDPEWPELLLALPYAVVRAEIEGEARQATFMVDLVARGYAKAGYDEIAAPEYQGCPVHERVELAYSYARAAALLEELRFLHGDQNIPNLMLDRSALDTQIIDLDAGAVQKTGRERAVAEGKGADQCLPPEVKVTAPGAHPIDNSRWDMGAERWSIGYIVGYLIFGVTPGFFLSPASAKTFDAYSTQGPWPDIDLDSPLFKVGNEAAYMYWRKRFESAPGEVAETFVRFFRAGTRGDERPTAQDWVDALEAARQKPRFDSVEVAPLVAPEGTEVVIAWKAEGADHVEHPTLGRLSPEGEARIVVGKSTRYALTAVNYYGRVTRETEIVRAVPLPRLQTIPLAGFPQLELRATIATGVPARPALPEAPRLVHAAGLPPRVPVPLRGPQALPPAPRFGSLFKPIPVSRQIRSTMRKGPSK